MKQLIILLQSVLWIFSVNDFSYPSQGERLRLDINNSKVKQRRGTRDKGSPIVRVLKPGKHFKTHKLKFKSTLTKAHYVGP